MLRTVKSLPSLRVLSSTRYNIAVPNIPHYQTRFVHQTSKKDATPILNSKKSEFSLMSLQTLKTECRKRGLKVSGRKAELVSRIANHESSFSTRDNANMSTLQRPKTSPMKPVGSMNFSKSATPSAKGDDSHIDFIHPVDMEPVKSVADDYIIQIPSISTEASKVKVTEMEKKLEQSVNLSDTIVSKAPGSDSRIFEHGSLSKIEDQNANAYEATLSEDAEHEEKSYEYDEGNITSRDKGIFAAFAGVSALWMMLKPKKSSKKAASKEEETN